MHKANEEKIEESQEILQALTFTVAKKKRIPKDNDTTNMVLGALSTAIQVMAEIKQYRKFGLTLEQLQEIDKLYLGICKELAEIKKQLPPCNIGDNIYLLIPDVWEVFECEVIEIRNNHCGEYFKAKVEGREWNIAFQRKDIRKTIFLTAADLRKVLEEKNE